VRFAWVYFAEYLPAWLGRLFHRRVAPPLLNDLVALQKDVGLISLAGPIDAIRAAQIQTASSYNYTPYILAGVLFVLLAIPLIAVTDWATMRAARRQSSAGNA